MSEHQGALMEKKSRCWQVSNLRSSRETDFDSVVVTTLAGALGELRWTHEDKTENHLSAGLESAVRTTEENRFLICSGASWPCV
jgi:hypothetical protein